MDGWIIYVLLVVSFWKALFSGAFAVSFREGIKHKKRFRRLHLQVEGSKSFWLDRPIVGGLGSWVILIFPVCDREVVIYWLSKLAHIFYLYNF